MKGKKKPLIQLLEQANSSSTSKLLKLSLLMLSERHHLRVAQNTGRVEEEESQLSVMEGLIKEANPFPGGFFLFFSGWAGGGLLDGSCCAKSTALLCSR